MEAKKVLDIALSAGQILLSNGAEAYRIEETVENICRAYKLECECMVTDRGVFVSVVDAEDEKVTSLKKIGTRRVDLLRIELVNTFSRNIREKSMTYEEAKKRLKDVEKAPYYSFKVRLFSAAMTSFIYALFLNGTIYDSIVSSVISVGIYYMLEKVSGIGFFQFFQVFISAFIIGSVSTALHNMFPILIKDNVITGAIMILLPGVALTNGMKDIIYGDFVSGMAKFCEAVLTLVALGAGIGAALFFRIGV